MAKLLFSYIFSFSKKCDIDRAFYVLFSWAQDQPRPPVYNVEDYAGALRKFGKRGPTNDGNNCNDSSSEPKQTEMTLKEFTSATELLEKLKADLKLAYFR